jgi:hypothetical protein
MEKTIRGAAGDAGSRGEQSALQNKSTSTTTLRLVFLWLVVGLPLLWGVIKALDDVRFLVE